ncbi:MAG: hypothetical protein V1934_06715 [Methanobacteriota archaeon]
MKLEMDPCQIFAGERTPIALRVRMDHMGERGCAFTAEKLAGQILVGQRPDHSWGTTSETVRALYDLSVLKPGGNLITRSGVGWLLEEHLPPMAQASTDGSPYDNLFFKVEKYESKRLNELSGTPFTKGCSGFIKTGAALYLASANRMHAHERVAAALESLDKVIAIRNGRWCRPSCSNNILQGYAMHPEAKDGPAMRSAIAALAKLQKSSGIWTGAPFYPTLYAMSNCESKQAARQVEIALAKCARTQKRDGSWGGKNKLHDTYMVIEALKRSGEI